MSIKNRKKMNEAKDRFKLKWYLSKKFLIVITVILVLISWFFGIYLYGVNYLDDQWSEKTKNIVKIIFSLLIFFNIVIVVILWRMRAKTIKKMLIKYKKSI
ncbi:hypothetical protein ACXYRQ_01300 [Mycoplasma sp. 394]